MQKCDCFQTFEQYILYTLLLFANETVHLYLQQERIKELFDLAVQRQTKEMNDNINGYGIDNHLMGLRYAAQEVGEPVPDIFTDQAYKIVNHFALSTSQVST